MNQIACPFCRGVISGQGIAPGQLLVCPHCGRQFVRPGGAAAAQAAAPAAAPTPTRVPTAAPAPARTGGGGQTPLDEGFAAQYVEQRQSQASKSVIWIVLSVVVAIVLLGLLFGAIVFSQMGKIRTDLEPQLYSEARKRIADTSESETESVTKMLNTPPGVTIELEDHHIDFGVDRATVYIAVKRQRKFVTVKFRLRDGEWSIDGPIEVRNRK